MIIPGLGLFYGGLVRAKNMLSVLMQCTVIACVVMIIWVVYGYSFAFGGGTNAFFGGFAKVFLAGMTPDINCGNLLQGRRHPGIYLHAVPDDLRGHHAGADPRCLC